MIKDANRKGCSGKVLAGLSEAVPARRLGLTEDELEFLKELHLLTMKPVLYVANVSEEEVADASANPHVQAVAKYAAGEGAGSDYRIGEDGIGDRGTAR